MKSVPLKQCNQALFVGVNIDEHLTWKQHITRVNALIRTKAGTLFRLRNFVPQNILVLLYKAFIQPYITYGLEVWGNTYSSYLNPILITQKMCLRAITFSGLRNPSSPLFHKLRILDVYKLYKLLVGNFVFDLYHQNVPHPMTDYFQVVDHCYDTRQKLGMNLTLPKMHTCKGQSAISYTGAQLWNSLPNVIKAHTSRCSFTKALREHLLLEYLK